MTSFNPLYINEDFIDFSIYQSTPWLKISDLKDAFPCLGSDTTRIISQSSIPVDSVKSGASVGSSGKSLYLSFDCLHLIWENYPISIESYDLICEYFSSIGFSRPSTLNSDSITLDVGQGVSLTVPTSTLVNLVKTHLL